MLVVLAACADVRVRPDPVAPAIAPSTVPDPGRIVAVPLRPLGEAATVGCDESRYATLGEALAATPPHATVTLCAGEYAESIEVDRDLTLAAADGEEVTLTSGDPALTVLRISGGATVALAGLKFAGDDSWERALRIEGGSVVTGADLGFEGIPGGAVAVEGAAFTCSDCVLRGNGKLAEQGGAVRASAAEVTLERSMVGENDALEGGAVFAELGSTVTLRETDLARNSAYQGGVAYVTDSALVLWKSDLVGNVADEASALYLLGATAEATGDPADLVHRGKIASNVATEPLRGAVELFPSDAGVDSSFVSASVLWTVGIPIVNPIDRNTEWDVFFGFLDQEERAAWGYRFGAGYNETVFECLSDVDNDFAGPYPGLCNL